MMNTNVPLRDNDVTQGNVPFFCLEEESYRFEENPV